MPYKGKQLIWRLLFLYPLICSISSSQLALNNKFLATTHCHLSDKNEGYKWMQNGVGVNSFQDRGFQSTPTHTVQGITFSDNIHDHRQLIY